MAKRIKPAHKTGITLGSPVAIMMNGRFETGFFLVKETKKLYLVGGPSLNGTIRVWPQYVIAEELASDENAKILEAEAARKKQLAEKKAA